MQDPRIGNIQPPPPAGPDPAPPAKPAAFPGGHKPPYVGQIVHFFPHKGHHPEEYFGPHAAIVIKLHPADPKIAHLHYFGPKGESGSYADIPHRSLRPECEPIAGWLGHAMPPSTHWAFTDEPPGPPLPPAAPALRPAP